ncbi:Hpt domain-containing protein [Flavilitoribacter nigricans]|uniref:HPt domain-containing protein n=1 Tax=Flavilitoribacter nigricans (strain ATCC 23147 / DSM 23189 / NBRC 102662 / NCIMB 1420 / SS-2) TaxID=1122177 RepID=A0A2D0N3W8_FLAN2|nr:Hpt domain-containing protein [Flavilitoribacter nigricans]PHN03090.1 hypothetical protein CRP01_28845 [Flavilitoribacter nigricans DSM 23189 = NBRC 102662]
MTYQYIQLAYLDTIAGDDPQLRQTLLEMVQAELSAAVPEMNQALEDQQWEELHSIVHKLKSTLAFIGNQELTTLNQDMLSCLEERNYEADFGTWLSKYDHLSGPIRKELQQELAN